MRRQPLPGPESRRPLTVLNAGAGRGATLNLTAFEAWNRSSTTSALTVRSVDPAPGKAQLLAEEGHRRGLTVEAIEARIEEIVAVPEMNEAPLILNLDQADAIAEVLSLPETVERDVLGYLLIRLPEGTLFALRFTLRRGALTPRQEAILLLSRLGSLAAPVGSEAILGEEGSFRYRAGEPRFRAWMARHTEEVLTKLVAGTRVSGSPLEVTTDGLTTRALFVGERPSWSNPTELVEQLLEDPPSPLRPGDFVLAEVTPLGVRFHEVRFGGRDRRVRLRGTLEVVSAPARTGTVSMTSPVVTTD